MNRPTALLLAALLVASLSAPQVFGQSRNNNQSRKLGSVIAGGRSSLIGSNVFVSVISGGMSNWIYTSLNSTNSPGVTIGGGIGNHVSGDLCTVSGGGTNDVWGEGATVAGGTKNTAAGNSCFVGGGFLNQARNYNAVVAGGWLNEATGNYSFIGGGQHNNARQWASVVAGGQFNSASNSYTTVSGGSNNTASGTYATVPGGARNSAAHAGSFVWSGVDSVDTVSTNTNSFTVRAPGGVRFITTDATNNLVIGSVFNAVNGVGVEPGGTQWQSLSDSNSKTDFESIKPREILSKVAALPVTSWHYKHDLKRRYIGPMAQDFHAAFGLGSDDKSIGTLDSDGVMYAAIQGLVEELKERDKAIEELKSKSAKVDRLESELQALRQQLQSGLPPGR